MKHLTYANKSLMVGDEVADLLLEYGARLASSGVADTVDVNAISGDGDGVTATFLLGEGAPLMAETTHSTLPEPDNAAALRYITERLAALQPTAVAAELDSDAAALDELYSES